MVVRIRIRLETPRFRRWRHCWAAVACLAVCATSTADMPPALIIRYPAPDPRAARLERFFHNYHCPPPYHVTEYLRAADDYNLDYRLLPAVSLRETTCGEAETDNNFWGFHPGRQTFPSVEAGIAFMARRLAKGTYYRGKTTQEKLAAYNPRPAYLDQVLRIMSKIEEPNRPPR